MCFSVNTHMVARIFETYVIFIEKFIQLQSYSFPGNESGIVIYFLYSISILLKCKEKYRYLLAIAHEKIHDKIVNSLYKTTKFFYFYKHYFLQLLVDINSPDKRDRKMRNVRSYSKRRTFSSINGSNRSVLSRSKNQGQSTSRRQSNALSRTDVLSALLSRSGATISRRKVTIPCREHKYSYSRHSRRRRCVLFSCASTN